jgi:hypothetical protein
VLAPGWFGPWFVVEDIMITYDASDVTSQTSLVTTVNRRVTPRRRLAEREIHATWQAKDQILLRVSQCTVHISVAKWVYIECATLLENGRCVPMKCHWRGVRMRIQRRRIFRSFGGCKHLISQQWQRHRRDLQHPRHISVQGPSMWDECCRCILCMSTEELEAVAE